MKRGQLPVLTSSLIYSLSLGLGLSLQLLAPSNAQAFELRGIQRNNEGVRQFGDEKHREAFDHFAQGLGDLPFQPETHYNLGRTYFENKEFEKALQESLTAAKLADETQNRELKFYALFQAGAAAAGLKKVDEALVHYQQALAIKPDSKETKTNIELLIAGGGGGSGDNQNQDPSQGDQQQQDGPGEGQQNQPKQVQNPKPQPRQFKGEELSKKDVENILDELKQQEEQIRAKFQREGAKDAPKEKDW